MLRVELARFTATIGMILISMLSAALGAWFTTFGAFLAAAISLLMFARRALGATLLALGATRFGLLLLIGLRRGLLTLAADRNRESSQQEGEQHNEYRALSGFHFSSPKKMITVGHQCTHRHFRCETLASYLKSWRKFFKSGKHSSEDKLDHDSESTA
jgi:hypothetical protein